MIKFLIPAALALSLSACVSFPDLNDEMTPERCTQIIEGLDRAEDIARFIAKLGIESDTATEVANYIAQGRLLADTVCMVILNPPPAPTPTEAVVNQMNTI